MHRCFLKRGVAIKFYKLFFPRFPVDVVIVPKNQRVSAVGKFPLRKSERANIMWIDYDSSGKRGYMTRQKLATTGMATSKVTMTIANCKEGDDDDNTTSFVFARQTTPWGIIHVLTDVVESFDFRMLYWNWKRSSSCHLVGTINVSVLISGCSIVMECWLHQKVHDNDKRADASVPVFG
jgi:hypothetical protein